MLFEVKEKFKLRDDFIDQFRGQQPEWGPLGYVTYKRSYARQVPGEDRTEEYWETVRRVVEGCYTVQLNHCKSLKLPWNAWKAQKSAQEMYRLMWEFKFLPPGRGLWAMGSDVVWKKGGAALLNCGFISTESIDVDFAEPFVFMMDMSMLGVGVAFDTKGAGKVEIRDPKVKEDTTFVVEDSKEGWCEVVRLILNAYVGKAALPGEIDYSKIRPQGSPIRTFGGVAPGPGPLIECVDTLRVVLDESVGTKVSSTLIADLMNIIGKCVVSGGLRRTAQLILGDSSDVEYLQLKDPVLHGDKLTAWRWASNNSVEARIGMDYTDIADQTAKNGEPGYFWLENARAYGRLGDPPNWKDELAAGTNPCVTGDTLVAVADGRGHVRIDEIEDGTLVYCLSDKDELTVRPMRHPRITGYQVPVFKVSLDDGSSVRVTANHKFLLTDGTYRETRNLRPGDALRILNRYTPDGRSRSRRDQYICYSYREAVYYEHVLTAKYSHGREDITGYRVHHENGIKTDNRPENLRLVQSTAHLEGHSGGLSDPRAYEVSNEELLEIGMAFCQQLHRRFSIEEWMEFAKQRDIPCQFSEYRVKALGTVEEFSKRCAALAGIDLPDVDPRTLRFYLECVKAGYTADIEDGTVVVEKRCEVCQKPFKIAANRREQGVCSHSCNNRIRDYSKTKESTRKTLEAKHVVLREKQAKVFNDLRFSSRGEAPLKKEWMAACKSSGISCEIGRKSSPFTSYDDLKKYAFQVNHRVVSVNPDGVADVWNGTVDEFHNFFLGAFVGETSQGREKQCYINSTNCGEQTLENAETCCLCENFPSRHENYEEFERTLKYSYLYAKTVTLIPTHSERSNAVMLRNRRIGLSLSGIVQAMERHGRRNFLEWCDKGYRYVQHLDKKYSQWLCVPQSCKTSTVKPSGSISLLPGVTPGIHYPHSKYYYRTIRFTQGSSIIDALRKAGYRLEDSVYGDNSVVAYFPVEEKLFDRAKHEVSIWEQLENAAALQHYWSDNQVSVTVTFRPEEAKDIPRALELYETRLKSVSFLPLTDHQYAQAPYQEITEEEYRRAVDSIKPLDLSGNTHEEEEKYCDGDRCVVNPEPSS